MKHLLLPSNWGQAMSLHSGKLFFLIMMCITLPLTAAETKMPDFYFRVKLIRTVPEQKQVRIGVSVFCNYRFFAWKTYGKFGVGKVSGKMPFSTGLKDILPWNQIKSKDMFHIGETSQWINISEDMAGKKGISAAPPALKTMCIAFQSPDLPYTPGEVPLPRPIRRGNKGDGGNLQGVTALIEFADAPDEKHIVKSLRITTDLSVIPIVFDGVLDDKRELLPLRKIRRICHINDMLKSEYDWLKKTFGAAPAPIMKHCVSSSWIHHGYQFNLYDSKAERIRFAALRLMGFNYINYYITPARTPAPPGVSLQFIEFPTGPEWLLPLFGPIDEEKALARIREYVERWMTDYRIDRTKEVYCRIGDEIKLIPEKKLLKEPAFLPAFRNYLKQQGVQLDGEIKPISKKDVRTEQDAKIYYYSVKFRHKLTLDMWKTYMRLYRKAFGKTPVRFGMESCGVDYDEWPTYLEMSQVPLMDFFIHEYTTKMWIPHHYAIGKAARHAAAAKFGKEEMGGLFAPGRIATEVGNDMLGITALSRGFRHVFFYGSFPNDRKTQKVVQGSIIRFNHRFAKLEDYILNGTSTVNNGIVAVGISHASDLWRGKTWSSKATSYLARGVLAERSMLMAALGMNQIPFDYLEESIMEQYLKNYKILFLPDPNLTEKAQILVADWVKKGGHVITIAAGASLNEFNMPSALGDKLIPGYLAKRKGDRNKAYGEYAPELYTKFKPVGKVMIREKETDFVLIREELNEKNGNIICRWENQKPAAVTYPVGKGKWTHIGFLPGTAMARSAAPVFMKSLKHLRKPALQHEQCEFAPELLALYPSLIPEAMAARKIWTDRPGVDCTLWQKANNGVILLADYGSGKVKNVTISLRTSQNWTSCTAENGKVYPFRKNNDLLSVTIPLASVEVLTLH